MRIYPSGKLHVMQTQNYKNAQVDQIFNDLPGSSPSLNSSKDISEVEDKMDRELSSLKEFIKNELIKTFNIEERKLNSKAGWYSEKTDHESNEMSGFFMIPTYSKDKKFSKQDLSNLISRLKSKFSDLQFSSEISGDNYKVNFKSIKKEEKSTDSFDSLPSISKAASNNSDLFSELLSQRKDYLYKKLRNIK